MGNDEMPRRHVLPSRIDGARAVRGGHVERRDGAGGAVRSLNEPVCISERDPEREPEYESKLRPEY